MILHCHNCKRPLWQLGGDPDWEGKDHSRGKPGTVITSADEKQQVPACLECANTREIAEPIAEKLNQL